MGPNTRRYNKFKGYSAADCDCKYCLHNGGKKRGCLVPVCCCLEERIKAGCDLTRGADGYRHIGNTCGEIVCVTGRNAR